MHAPGHFVSLDDAHTGRRILLTDLQRTDLVDLATIDAALADGWLNGWHAFAWLPYDLGEAHLGIRGVKQGALYWFAGREHGPLTWDHPAGGWLGTISADLDAGTFAERIAQVHQAIAEGTVYQVNFTHRLTARFAGDPRQLYRSLSARQPVAYGALAHLPPPAASWTLSLSPELFLRVSDGSVLTQPMKGTAAAHSDPDVLSGDPKNRAENLMIVDLMRNDLSRVCVPGTVAVPALFSVERVGELWQMTSTVRGDLLPGTTPGQLLAATFPCGSITGAPKLASMALIRDLERGPRGLYTGSLGIIEPDDGPLGWRTTLSIAIRTLEITPEGSAHNALLGVGSGVVADSTAADEWGEAQGKAAFVRELGLSLDLIETIRVVDGAAPLAARHRARLERSAAELGFTPHDPEGFRLAIAEASPGAWMVRLQVRPDGGLTVTRSPLEEVATPVTVLLASEPWAPVMPLSRHKTTHRAHLDDALRVAGDLGAFDMIGHDAHGRVLEGGRCSVFARIDGVWRTPPLELAILDGVQRAEVLASPALIGAQHIEQEAFTVADLLRAEAVVVTNAVRGVLPARLESP